jgi:hypothetical protein
VQSFGLGTGSLAHRGSVDLECSPGTGASASSRSSTHRLSFAPARSETNEQQPRTCGYGKPTVAASWKADRFSGQDFVLQPDGTLRCPANQKLSAHERRREADGSLRVVYAASIRSCRPCPLREQCQWNGGATAKPRQVSILLHPVVIGSAPVLWCDWSRRVHRLTKCATRLLKS